ncbi:MAG: hypothetical protein ACLFO2_02370 [Candidatus Woesearchaeota archaeon]
MMYFHHDRWFDEEKLRPLRRALVAELLDECDGSFALLGCEKVADGAWVHEDLDVVVSLRVEPRLRL